MRRVLVAENGCWLWQGYRDAKGYGNFYIQGAGYRAHRVAYEMFEGKHPGALLVCHSCDNPSCVNPAHLFAGSAKDNTADMLAKGRGSFGETHGQAKLTTPKVREIRTGGLSVYAAAKHYGVSRKCIRLVRARNTWRHIL